MMHGDHSQRLVGGRIRGRTVRGDDIIPLNRHRRHLNESQRALIAAKLANMRQGERTDLEPSLRLGKVNQGERTDLQPSATLPKVSQATAAELANMPLGGETYRSANVRTDLAPLANSQKVSQQPAAELWHGPLHPSPQTHPLTASRPLGRTISDQRVHLCKNLRFE